MKYGAPRERTSSLGYTSRVIRLRKELSVSCACVFTPRPRETLHCCQFAAEWTTLFHWLLSVTDLINTIAPGDATQFKKPVSYTSHTVVQSTYRWICQQHVPVCRQHSVVCGLCCRAGVLRFQTGWHYQPICLSCRWVKKTACPRKTEL